ncbi:MAG: hypothetical protein R3D27_11095 [Hyphomicrobiaceae bacterium]
MSTGFSFSVAAVLVMASVPAAASMPVPVTAIGCYSGNMLESGKSRLRLVDRNQRPMPAGTLAGKTVSVEGMLTPDGRLTVVELTVVDDRCRRKLHSFEFLCSPCSTTAPRQRAPARPSRTTGSR